LALRKFDPLVNRYVLFTEQKLKKWRALTLNFTPLISLLI
jgi:hypothetical protein